MKLFKSFKTYENIIKNKINISTCKNSDIVHLIYSRNDDNLKNRTDILYL